MTVGGGWFVVFAKFRDAAVSFHIFAPTFALGATQGIQHWVCVVGVLLAVRSIHGRVLGIFWETFPKGGYRGPRGPHRRLVRGERRAQQVEWTCGFARPNIPITSTIDFCAIDWLVDYFKSPMIGLPGTRPRG